jgi:hypothetical protein
MSVTACADSPAGIRPLVSAARRVVVDGHPICAVCGQTVELMAPDRWRHAPRRRKGNGNSKWLSPVTLGKLRKLSTYEQFKARFPWATATSEEDWQEGARRLEEYHARLAAAGRRRALRAGENPYLELVNLVMASSPGLSQMLDPSERRRELASLFSWAIPTEQALDVIAKYAPLAECGAGMGYWTALLEARGVDAIAYDLLPPGANAENAYHKRRRQPWTEVQRGSAVAAARRHRDRALVLCWPPYDDDAASYSALRAYRGDVVIYIGERDEGATGSVRFHRELGLNWTLAEEVDLPHWPSLRDRLMVYRRNAQRRPHVERDRCFECKRFIRTGGIGRCDWCFHRRPTPLALQVGKHRVEYPREILDTMPAALRKAFEASPNRIR